jgi:opacity protein-like surface antigen
VAWVGFAVLGILLPAEASAEHFLYVSPTVGAWRWDQDVYPLLRLDEFGPVYGARVGYKATTAFSMELVGLSGTTDAASVAGGSAATEALRQTLIELSLVVNFQSLAGDRIYPFLDLGSGLAMRRGGPETPEEPRVDEDHFAFHLGGGLQMELDSRWALRVNVRDSFFSKDRSIGNGGDQVTVDSLELSVGLTMKFPVGKPGTNSLQLRGIDAGPKLE